MSTSSITNRPNRKPSHAENGKEMVRKVTSFAGEVIHGKEEKCVTNIGSHQKQKNGKEMVRKVTNFDGEVMVV